MFGEMGEVVAKQMDAIMEEYKGREDEFSYEGSVSLVLYSTPDDPHVKIRWHTNCCMSCTLKALYMAMQDLIFAIPCEGDGAEAQSD